MLKLIFLGTSNAISDAKHENTHMLLVGGQRMVLIDCPNSPLIRFQHANVDSTRLSDLILTHFHPDHVAGVPQLLMDLWLMGRRQPLNIHGLAHTLDRVEKMMGLYGWSDWPGFYPVEFHRLPEQPLARLIETEEFRILAVPMKHFIPTIGLRMEFAASKKPLAYTCDTEPCPQMAQLAGGADILVHESTGAQPGHSSAAQAGQAASQAGVGSLYLIHYPNGQYTRRELLAEARAHFAGPVALAEDFMQLNFD